MSHLNEWGSGPSFVRDHDGGRSYVVVGLAIGSDQTIIVQGVLNGTYRDAVTGREIVVHDGTLAFDVRGSSAGIYALDGPGRIGVDGVLSALRLAVPVPSRTRSASPASRAQAATGCTSSRPSSPPSTAAPVASPRTSSLARSHAATRAIRRNTNRRHMMGDHHGRTARESKPAGQSHGRDFRHAHPPATH